MSAVVYTCPLDRVCVVREVILLPATAPSGAVFLTLTGVSTIVGLTGVAALVTSRTALRTVLLPGETLTLITPSVTWEYTISGYELG